MREHSYFYRMETAADFIADEGSEELYERKAFTVNKGQEPLRLSLIHI